MNSQSFLFYFTGVIWNKSHILTVKIIWPMPIFDWRINIKIEASSAVSIILDRYLQNTSLLKTHPSCQTNLTPLVWIAIIMWPPVKSSPHTLFSKFILMSVIFLFWFAKVFAYDVWFMFIYTIYIYFLKFLYQRILRMFSSQRKMERKTERKIERFKYHSHCLCTEVNRNGSDNLVLDIPL